MGLFEASEKENSQKPQAKSLRLAVVRLVDNVTNKIMVETDIQVLNKLNASLITASMAMTILNDDYMRAGRLISKARRLANVKEENTDEE